MKWIKRIHLIFIGQQVSLAVRAVINKYFLHEDKFQFFIDAGNESQSEIVGDVNKEVKKQIENGDQEGATGKNDY